jgi:DNA-binding MarR family transcriptional regulator
MTTKSKERSTVAKRASAVEAEPVAAPARLSQLLLLAVRRAETRATERLVDALTPHGATPQQFTTLLIIAEKPGLKLVELARALGIARSGAVVLVDELEGRGQVKRRPMPGDRRAHSLNITVKGSRALEKQVAAVDRCEEELFGELNIRDRAALLRILDRLAPPAA